jgi:hypothetical protein
MNPDRKWVLAGGATALALGLALLPPTAARAVDYPWCYIDQTKSGSTSCAFETLAQCRENAGGNGGFCVPNPFRHEPRVPRRGQPR